MGVKDLWSIVDPVKQHTPLSSLEGKTVAVDLSIWIVSNQGSKQLSSAVAKPHLRNLFFRVSTLLHLGVKLIFVVDGEAPALKGETISKRIDVRRGRVRQGLKPSTKKISKPKRTGLNIFIRECLGLLDGLGVPYIYSKGEAEAMCGLLNSEGIVDGCITDDGDVFLYGARTVYRNFTLDKKDPSVDLYNMSDIETVLGLDRGRLVAMALLLGCDYVPKGVPGVGKEQVMKLLAELGDVDVLTRIQDWKIGKRTPEIMSSQRFVKKVTHCSTCHHPGSLREHKSSGCRLCKSRVLCHTNSQPCPCDWHIQSTQADKHKLELSIMTKLCGIKDYPLSEVIDEFLNQKETLPQSPTVWRQVDISALQKYLYDKLDWPERYTLEKSLPLLTHWILTEKISNKEYRGVIAPEEVVKLRVQQRQDCVQVKWNLPDVFYTEDSPCDDTLSHTTESLQLFGSAYPDMLATFLDQKQQQKEQKGKKSRKKKVEAVEVVPPEESDGDYLKLLSDMSHMGLEQVHTQDCVLGENSTRGAGHEELPSASEDLSDVRRESYDYQSNSPTFPSISDERNSPEEFYQTLDDSRGVYSLSSSVGESGDVGDTGSDSKISAENILDDSSLLENSELECELSGVDPETYERLYFTSTDRGVTSDTGVTGDNNSPVRDSDNGLKGVNEPAVAESFSCADWDPSMDLFLSPTSGEIKEHSSHRGDNKENDLLGENISPPPSTSGFTLSPLTPHNILTDDLDDSPLPLALRLQKRAGHSNLFKL